MPIRPFKLEPRSSSAAALVERLVEEWRNPSDKAPEPIIMVKDSRPKGGVELYVVWSEWATLDQQERSEIIMFAYEQLASEDDAAAVTVALGLTRPEAQRMGIKLE